MERGGEGFRAGDWDPDRHVGFALVVVLKLLYALLSSRFSLCMCQKCNKESVVVRILLQSNHGAAV